MRRHVFLTFASAAFHGSMRRLLSEVCLSGAFDTYVGLTESNIPDFVAEHEQALVSERGFGYMIWKPHVIAQTLEKLDDGDILVYSDAGSAYNIHGTRRLRTYFDKAARAESGVVCFRLFGHTNAQWCKADVASALDPGGEFTNERQVTSCLLVIRKCARSVAMVREWAGFVKDKAYGMFDDSESKLPNPPCFREHRHDQSVLSLLCYKHGCEMLDDETWFFRAWASHGITCPFWALRRRSGGCRSS